MKEFVDQIFQSIEHQLDNKGEILFQKQGSSYRIRTTKRSLIAEFFYNETKYREGSGSERIVSEIDELFKKGKSIWGRTTLTA